MQVFLCGRNLRDDTLADLAPWDFHPEPQALAELRAMQKSKRKLHLLRKETDWQIYTAVAGVNPGTILNADNPAAHVRGLVADYDTKMTIETVVGILNQMSAAFRPNFIEVSLGMKIRLVWIFEKPLPVTGSPHAQAVYNTFAEKFKVATLLPGFDENSAKPAERWTNGGEWYDVCEKPLPWELVFGLAVDAAKKLVPARADVPLEKVAEEIEKKWPGRWKGEFKLDALGVRFWDASADCEMGCQVKPDGMLCFTGRVGFVRWEQLFGPGWVHEQAALNIANTAKDIYFDGQQYYHLIKGQWESHSREDTMLALSEMGLDTQRRRGQTISDAHRVLRHIQLVNRVEGCAPLIYEPKGVVNINLRRFLNTSRLTLVEPASHPCTFSDFPLTWKLQSGLFIPIEPGDLFDPRNPLPHILAWEQRGYVALRDCVPLMGQAIFICGPVNSGKTLYCAHVIRPMFGGSMVNPFDYMVGRTTFTDELFGAALWAINDEESPAGERERLAFMAKIKSSVVNPELTYHPKFCKKLSLPCQPRLLITGNIDPTALGMLPEVNDSTRDKLMFFAAQEYQGRWPDRKTIEATLRRELPCFLRWLLDWQPPAEVLAPGRMGVRSYYDPMLLAAANQQSHSYNFKELLMLFAQLSTTFNETVPAWEGNPTKLMAEMSIVEPLVPLLRDWTVPKIAKALTSLARVGGQGVEFKPGSQERVFKITRESFPPTT